MKLAITIVALLAMGLSALLAVTLLFSDGTLLLPASAAFIFTVAIFVTDAAALFGWYMWYYTP